MKKVVPAIVFQSFVDVYHNYFIVFDDESVVSYNEHAERHISQADKDELFDKLWPHRSQRNISIHLKSGRFFFVESIVEAVHDSMAYYACVLSDRSLCDPRVLSRIVEESSVAMIVFDRDLHICYANLLALSLYGYEKQELIGHHLSMLMQNGTKEFFIDCFADLAEKRLWRGEDVRKKKDGTLFISSSSFTEVRDANGEFLCYYDASRDNSVQALLHRTMEVAAKTDALTGIPNRRSLLLMLEQQWDFALAHAIPVSIIFCDIDYFKQYNDTYGHLMGDKALKAVATVNSYC